MKLKMKKNKNFDTLYEEKINKLFNHLSMKNFKMNFKEISDIETKIITEQITTTTQLNKEIKGVLNGRV